LSAKRIHTTIATGYGLLYHVIINKINCQGNQTISGKQEKPVNLNLASTCSCKWQPHSW